MVSMKDYTPESNSVEESTISYPEKKELTTKCLDSTETHDPLRFRNHMPRFTRVAPR